MALILDIVNADFAVQVSEKKDTHKHKMTKFESRHDRGLKDYLPMQCLEIQH